MAELMKSKRGSKMRGIQLLKLRDVFLEKQRYGLQMSNFMISLLLFHLIPVSMYKISKYKLLVTM